MAENISGFGLIVRILASNTFPTGIELTQFADDTDPLDAPSMEITGSAMGLNGDKVNWTMANIIPMTIALIGQSNDDINMSVLAEANRAGRGKVSARDTITAIVFYPSGRITTLTGGTIDAFVPADSVSSEGRLKSKPYIFSFENRTSVGPL